MVVVVLWQQIRSLVSSQPMVVLGEFNCMLRYKEKKGGRLPRSQAMEEFRSPMDDSGLHEANSYGGSFTWYNNSSGKERIIHKIDRAFMSDA